jgi:hypothetical protein
MTLLNWQYVDVDISINLGDHHAAVEIRLPKMMIKHIPACCFNRRQKTMVFRSAYEL